MRLKVSILSAKRLSSMLVSLTFPAVALGCHTSVETLQAARLEVRSSSFTGDVIPAKYSSCSGQDGPSLQLSWSDPPKGTQSFAIIMFDQDSPLGFKFTHWVIYDLPGDKRELAENVPKQAQIPGGSRQGLNDDDRIGYLGPCPPRGTHHYLFTVYALDTNLNLPPGTNKKALQKAFKGHVLATGELVGRFRR